jgi:WD40 repeat protein
MDKNENHQSFFNLHDDDVVSMAVHPSRDIVATGQMAAKGKAKLIDIYVWNVTTKEDPGSPKQFPQRSYKKTRDFPQQVISFSPSEKTLRIPWPFMTGQIKNSCVNRPSTRIKFSMPLGKTRTNSRQSA